MREFIDKYKGFILMLIIWLIVGKLAGPAVLAIIPVCVYLMHKKKMYPELLMGFLFLIIISDSTYVFGFAKNAKNVYLVLLTAILILDRKNFREKSRVLYPFIPFLVLALALVAISPIQFYSLQKTIAYVLMFVTIPNYVLRIVNDHGETALKDIIMFFATILLVGVLLIPIVPGFVFKAGRFTGMLGNPNGIGIFCTIFFLFFSVVISRNPMLLNRNEKLFVYGIMILSILLAVSRNSFFSIALFVILARFYRVSRWYGFVAVLFAILLYQFVSENLVTIIDTLGLGQYLRADTLESGSGRLIAWAFAWEYIQKHFYFGQAFAYDDWIFGINQIKLNMMGHNGAVHNTYLSMWMNTGIIGLLLFLAAFFRTFFKVASKSYYALPVMFAVMFSITFESWLMGSLNPYTIVFLMIITLMHYDTRSISTNIAEEQEKSLVPVS